MSAIVVLTPLVIAGWPAITAAVAGAAAALGFTVQEAAKQAGKARDRETSRAVQVELAESAVLSENLASGQEIVVARGSVVLRVRRDDRGRLAVCASGTGQTDTELRAQAEDFAHRVTQVFVYHKVMSELKAKGFQVVHEEQQEDQSLRLRVRRWEG